MLSNLSVCLLVASYTPNYNGLGLGSLQELKVVVIGYTQGPEDCAGSLDFSGNLS